MNGAGGQPWSVLRGRRLSRRTVVLSLVVLLHMLAMLLALRPLGVPHRASGPQAIAVTLLPAQEEERAHATRQRHEVPPRHPATAPAEKAVTARRWSPTSGRR